MWVLARLSPLQGAYFIRTQHGFCMPPLILLLGLVTSSPALPDGQCTINDNSWKVSGSSGLNANDPQLNPLTDVLFLVQRIFSVQRGVDGGVHGTRNSGKRMAGFAADHKTDTFHQEAEMKGIKSHRSAFENVLALIDSAEESQNHADAASRMFIGLLGVGLLVLGCLFGAAIALTCCRSVDLLRTTEKPTETSKILFKLAQDDPKNFKDDVVKSYESTRLFLIMMLACCLGLARTGLQNHAYGAVACLGVLSNLFGVVCYHSLAVSGRLMQGKHLISFTERYPALLDINRVNIMLGFVLLLASICLAVIENFDIVLACSFCMAALLVLVVVTYVSLAAKDFVQHAAERDEAEKVAEASRVAAATSTAGTEAAEKKAADK